LTAAIGQGWTGMVLISRSRRNLPRRGLAAALPMFVFLTGAVILAGCSTGSVIADHLPTAAGGLPENTPQRPTAPPVYPAVHDLPPPRSDAMLTDEEQKRLEADLLAARKRAEAANAAGSAPKP
jgi:hypothetical protein